MVSGWSSVPSRRRSRGRRLRRPLSALVLLIPLVVGVLGTPAGTPVVRGNELDDARAKQAALKKQVAAQQAQVSQLNLLQVSLAAEIAGTASQLISINADLDAVRRKVTSMTARIKTVKANYDDLVNQVAAMDAQLAAVMADEATKRAELTARRKSLAERVRSAYDSERTSPLEALLSGGTFTDMLAQMSYYVDIGQQDRALAEQVRTSEEALQVLHQTVSDTRDTTNALSQQAAQQKRELDRNLADLNATKAALKVLEAKTAATLSRQRANYALIAHNKAAARRALAVAAASQRRLAARIADIVARQQQMGNVPSQYNGTLSWPMVGTVTQNFGCTGFAWEPPYGSCAHFHQGIDIVAPEGTPIKASGDGVVAYIGWNYADGADPAWIVIIAHSSTLSTWYAHMQPRFPGGIHQGSHISAGQVVGYEGNTGHSTGAHLHWAVQLNGTFVNPRLFL